MVPSSSPLMGVAVWQAMECRCWTLPHIASMKVIIPPVSVNHWMEVSTLAHHVDTKSILKPLVMVRTDKSINQGVVWYINHVVDFFFVLIWYVLHQSPPIIKNIDIVVNVNVNGTTLKGEQGQERRNIGTMRRRLAVCCSILVVGIRVVNSQESECCECGNTKGTAMFGCCYCFAVGFSNTHLMKMRIEEQCQ